MIQNSECVPYSKLYLINPYYIKTLRYCGRYVKKKSITLALCNVITKFRKNISIMKDAFSEEQMIVLLVRNDTILSGLVGR